MINKQAGFTLLEMLVSVSILTVVSLLTFVALQSSTQSNIVSAAKEEVGANLRDALLALNAEVRQAYTARTVDADPPIAPEDAFAITVINNGRGLRYCVPEPSPTSPIPGASAPIEIIFENEDIAGGAPNGLLEDGEDLNGDGALTRRLVRRENGVDRYLGSANNISDVLFSLEENSAAASTTLNTLTVTLSGSKAVTSGGNTSLVQSEISSRLHMEN